MRRRTRGAKKAQEALAGALNTVQSFAALPRNDRHNSGTEMVNWGYGQLGLTLTARSMPTSADASRFADDQNPTKGHAQKVLEPEKAVGRFIARRSAHSSRARAKIPVLCCSIKSRDDLSCSTTSLNFCATNSLEGSTRPPHIVVGRLSIRIAHAADDRASPAR